jgi:DNA-binding NarL/FixJ family response regulator
MEKKIRVILTEDQELMRKSLAALLNDFEQISVIGEASTGKDLVQLLKTVKPDVVLLDVEMPIMNGLEAMGIIKTRFPQVKVIVLSMHTEDVLITDFMTRGARAYLPKGCDVETLITTIENVHKNGFHFTENVSKAMLGHITREKSVNPFLSEQSLTEREMEVLRALCEGKTNKEIAQQLKLTPRTVDFHRANIYTKTKSRNVAELVKYAIKNGMA